MSLSGGTERESTDIDDGPSPKLLQPSFTDEKVVKHCDAVMLSLTVKSNILSVQFFN